MMTYLKAKTLSNITTILVEEELIRFQESTSESNTAVFFDTHDGEGEGYERFESMCLALSETLSCAKARFLSEVGKGAFLFKPYRWKSAEDKMMIQIEGSNPLAMAAFVDNNHNRLPLVCVRSSYTDKYLKAGTLPVVTMLYDVDFKYKPKASNYYANRWNRLSPIPFENSSNISLFSL
jgi:hypothetical protein